VAPCGESGEAISRILFPEDRAVIIHLGRRSPAASSDLPGSIGRAILKRFPIRSCSGWGLPGFPCCHENRWALTSPFHPYLQKTGGGLLSVALSLGLPPPGVTRHPALRSSDFPPALIAPAITLPPQTDRVIWHARKKSKTS